MGKYWNEEIECMAHEDMKKLQSERLVKQVKHVWDNVPYYKKLMEEKGVTPDDIHGIEDLHKLPFLSKADLREAYPYGLLAKPRCSRNLKRRSENYECTGRYPDGAFCFGHSH